MNLAIIACLFELVDGLYFFFLLFFPKIYFSEIFFGGPIHSFPGLRSGQKIFSKIVENIVKNCQKNVENK